VFAVGDMEAPEPVDGEVRVRLSFSGVNPGDIKVMEIADKPSATTIEYSLSVLGSWTRSVASCVGSTRDSWLARGFRDTAGRAICRRRRRVRRCGPPSR